MSASRIDKILELLDNPTQHRYIECAAGVDAERMAQVHRDFAASASLTMDQAARILGPMVRAAAREMREMSDAMARFSAVTAQSGDSIRALLAEWSKRRTPAFKRNKHFGYGR